MIFFTDTHCHLDFSDFDNDREEVIERAREAGIRRILNPGIDIPTSRAALDLAERYQEIYAAIGVHPNSALSWDEHTLNELEELAAHPKVVAIGEIGLDFYRDFAPREVQIDVLQAQLDLAARIKLPVVVHNRNAFDDIFFILHRWYLFLQSTNNIICYHPGVLHSFSDDETKAKQVFSDNFMIGITGPVTYKNDKGLQKTVSYLPMENILIETDAPFLSPHPLRGTRNEPARVRLVADKIAQLQEISIEVIADSTSANADRLFNWREVG